MNAFSFGVFKVFSKVARFDSFAKYSKENVKVVKGLKIEGEKSVKGGNKNVGGGVQENDQRMVEKNGKGLEGGEGHV